MNVVTRNIPNVITLANIACGLVAILLAFRGFERIGSLQAWQWSCIFIGIAAAADFFDGFTARMLHAYTNLGKELDSLCDLVSFGVAPMAVVFNVLEETGAPAWSVWFAMLIPLAGALRLARFNVDTRQTTSFIGLPIPANAIFWIGYSFILSGGVMALRAWPVFVTVAVVESWLMVSPLRLFSMKFKTYGWRTNEARYLLILGAVVFVACLGAGGLAWLVLFYVCLSQLPFARH
ncbi:MAG: CDP-diacylglycerol--serine O-phosphatidyltransferase [Muribaculum sp.]|nr:CDP-diacylglycerol--serine O-phosphatidyltransferase [Muribaculum sp.]